MNYNDSNTHVIKTSAQWNERAIEYWVVPRGCLCVELTPKGKTKIKIGEGNKNYYQLPYIGSSEELYNYYTKEEVDALLNNFNRMAIMSTDEYPSKSDLPTRGNKVGDVRFVAPSSPDIKPDPDLYVWDGRRWIYTGSPLVDMSEYVKTAEFNIVKNKVDEIFPMAHTHANKAVLDNINQEKLDEIDELAEMYDGVKTDITDLKSKSHTHSNKAVLDTVTQSSLMSTADRTKLDSLHNYDDTEVKSRLTVVESKAHTHDNKSVLDGITQEKLDEITELAATYIIVKQDITELKKKEHSHDNIDILNETDASYTIAQQNELNRLSNIGPFLGCGPTWNGIFGYVPAPEAGCQNYFLRGDGSWALIKATGDKYKAGEGIYILSGEVTADTFPFKLYAKGGYVKQYIIYGAPGGVGDYNSTTGKYHIPIRVSAEGHTPIDTVIQIEQKLYENDWLNYELQEYSVYRTNLTNDFRNLGNQQCFLAINQDGSIEGMPGSWGYQDGVSDYYEMDPDAIYELPKDTRDIYWRSNVNIYDANKNRTRTVLRSNTSVVNIIPQAGEKYLRIAAKVGAWEGSRFNEQLYTDPVLFRLKDTVFPVTIPLQQIQLIPNTINTIDVLTTVKPLDMYVETVVPPDPDPDDPMSEYTGIIYNDGVIDVTQDDPDNLNILTFHYRDNVTKDITVDTGITEGVVDITQENPDNLNELTITYADDTTNVITIPGGESSPYVRVSTDDSYILLHTKPSDWDDTWYKYYRLSYDEITTEPPNWDPTRHYKYENDNYVLGSPGDTFVSTTWYDKHYIGLDPNTPIIFDSDVYYTSALNLIQDGETFDTAFEKVNEAIEHIERLEQNVQFLHDNKVDVRETIDPERIEFYYS